jgi:hypothetical protein
VQRPPRLPPRAGLRLAGSVLVIAVAAGCAGGTSAVPRPDGSVSSGPASSGPASSGPASGTPPIAALPRPDHTVVVIMENHDFASIVDNPDAPWLNGLPAAVLTDWHGIAHPSQPNYIALFTGSTHGVTNNNCPVTVTGESLASQLAAAGRTFVGYSEGLPEVGSTVCLAGKYARKHNPWVDVVGLPPSVNQPFTAFPTDYSRLPTVAFVVPDLCHDTHDCPVRTGDDWLRNNLDRYLTWARTHNSLLVVTYDEGENGAPENHIPTHLAGPMVTPGRYPVRGDQYSMLRTLEALHGLPALGIAAQREPLTGIWR